MEKSSAFVRSPQSNGVIERFHRTLKEQLLVNHSIKNLDDIKQNIDKFVQRYNQKWLQHRLQLRSPFDYKKILPSGNTEREGVRH
ncbi:MAG: transposase [Saprospiraceae bacterium]|nr:transposase [Saprospiraceae bacterium]